MSVAVALDLTKRRKPKFKLPPGSCNSHCHVFGPAAKFPYAPGRRYTPEDAPKETLAALHAHLGVERSVIVQASCHGKDNRAMLDAIASAPHRYRGIAMVDDSFSDADLEALRPRRRARRAVQFRQASRRHARHGRVLAHGRSHQGVGLAPGAAPRCARHHPALGHDPEASRAPSSSITWDACRGRMA